MNVKLLDSLNYEEAAQVLRDSYFPQWILAGSPAWNAEYLKHLDEIFIKPNKAPYIGAFIDDNLIGIGMSAISTWKVEEIGEIKTAFICNLGVMPTYQRKGIATEMVNELVKELTGKVDLVYRICNDSLNDHLVLSNKCSFEKKIDNSYQLARILGKDMVPQASKYRELSKIKTQLIKVVAGLPKPEKTITEGTFRDGTLDDIKSISEIYASYQDSTPLIKIMSESDIKKFIENMALLDGVKFSKIFKVWEKEGLIKAYAIGRCEPINYRAGELTLPVISEVGFSSDLERKEKTTFMNTLILDLKADERCKDSFATNVAYAHLEEKAFDKAGYNNDTTVRPLYAKLLNNDLKEWFTTDWNRYKKYSILYFR